MAVTAPYPYGLSLSAYLDAFDRAQQQAQAQQLVGMRGASVMQDLMETQRKRQEEEQVMRDLTTEITARRAQPALQPNPQIVPAVPPIEGGPDTGPGLPGEPPRSLASMIPQVPPQVPFGSSVSPERQAAMLASPRARPVIQGIEEHEKQTERDRLREEARQLFDVAQERFKAGDMAGGSEELAKAYTRMGMHNEAGQHVERALKVRGDKEEEAKSGRDMDKFLKAESAYSGNPSITTYAALMAAMSNPESVTFRAFRTNLVQNQLKASLGRDPYSAMLFKKIAEKYRAGWEAGKQPTFDEVTKAVEMENPGLLFRVVANELEAGKPLQQEFAKRVLRIGEDIDPAKLKDEMGQAMELFRRDKAQKEGQARGPRTADEVSGVIDVAHKLLAKRKEAERTPAQKELDALNLEIKKQQAGQVVTPLQASLFAQRAAGTRKDAEAAGDQELVDQAISIERYWTQKQAELIKEKGGKVKEQGQYPAQKLLRAKPWAQLADEEKQAVLLDVAKRKLPAKVKTFEDLKALSAKEKQLLNNEISRLDQEMQGERGAGAGAPGD